MHLRVYSEVKRRPNGEQPPAGGQARQIYAMTPAVDPTSKVDLAKAIKLGTNEEGRQGCFFGWRC